MIARAEGGAGEVREDKVSFQQTGEQVRGAKRKKRDVKTSRSREGGWEAGMAVDRVCATELGS